MNQQFINQVEVLSHLQMSIKLVPGFNRAFAFFHHPIYKEIKAIKLSNSDKKLRIVDTHNLSSDINKLRQSEIKIEWVEEDDIPFEIVSKSTNIQKEVFDEYKHYILLIRIVNKWDNKSDLLYIYFKPNASNFGLKKLDNNFNTEHKSIISSFIKRSFDIYHQQRSEFEEVNNQLRNDNNILGSQLKKLKIESQVREKKVKSQLEKYIYHLLQNEAEKLNLHLQLTQEAQDYIQNFDGELSQLEDAAKSSISMAYRVQNTIEGGLLKVEDYYLKPFFNKEKETSVNTGIEAIEDSRYIKTIQMLNRLENAANKVQSNGANLSGSNIGQAMPSPISAPAISDALKKHKKKIQSLCEKYPDEWTLIRRSFRPVINILSA
ncbi:MAG: hypothetical protein DRI86_12930 [Bacteroidetes bacterium]|nr:MAG: hypothetical protein DRI86_12930 [Bacteroidota bacterium]